MQKTNIFELSKYLKHWKVSVAFALVLAIFVGYYLNNRQVVSTSASVTYNNESAADGYFADGSEIDASEIYSVDIITRVIDDLDLRVNNLPVSTGTLRNLIEIEEVIPEDKQALIDGASSKGEEYIYHPIEFKVTLNDSKGLFSKNQAIKIVSKLLDVYVEKYGRDHVIRTAIPAIPTNTTYDYLDRVELLDDSVKAMESFLGEMKNRDELFRSNSTGYSFSDLKDLYNECRNNDIHLLYSQILGEKITKDLEVLRYNYNNRITNCKLDIEDKNSELKKLEKLLESYVNKAKEQNRKGNIVSGNGTTTNSQSSNSINYDDYYIGNGTVLQDVYNEYYRRGQNFTTTYDDAISKYAELHGEIYNLGTEIDYCNTVLDIYKNCKENKTSEKIDETFVTLDKELDELYKIAKTTVADFDKVQGAENVTSSGIVQSESYNVRLYMIISGVLGLLLGMLFLIVFGHSRDMFKAYKARSAALDDKASADKPDGSDPAEESKDENEEAGKEAEDEAVEDAEEAAKETNEE